MPGTATTILIDGTPTNGSDPWVDSLVWGGAWTDGDGGPVKISWAAVQGTLDGESSMAWSPAALVALGQALALWESVANIDFVEAPKEAADVLFWQGTQWQAGGADVLGWSEVPGYSEDEVLNTLFNGEDSSWSADGLARGGSGFATLVHEIGHLLGLAHPHDGGSAADATVFPGVDWPYFDYGNGNLNQGIYTTMGYNSGWPSTLDDPVSETWGLEAGPMALDIAAIQAIYGANTAYAAGNNVYVLPTANAAGAFWSSLWDTGGVDTISNAGSTGDSMIDLNAATVGIGGGGTPSYGYDSSGAAIHGGFTIARGVVIENAIGGSGADTLTGNAGNNRLEGGGGNDTLIGGTGIDTMIGGLGDDTYELDTASDVIVENVGEGIDTIRANFTYTLGAAFENLTLYGASLILSGTGNGLDNILTGTSIANQLTGGGGNDTLIGGGGGDLMIGGVGNDIYEVDSTLDTVTEVAGEGIDTVRSSINNYVLGITLENLELTGTGNLNGTGNAFDNVLTGNVNTNTLTGGGGNDTLFGGGGVDALVGGTGNDTYIVLPGNLEMIWENTGEGTDTVRSTAASYTLGANVEKLVLTGTDHIDGTGNSLNNVLTGNSGHNRLNGGAGADTMAGGLNNDIYTVDNYGDVVIETFDEGFDTVLTGLSYTLTAANVEMLQLTGASNINGTGNDGDNRLMGNDGSNRLEGGAGNDWLHGGNSGLDTLIGGLGDDTYHLWGAPTIFVEEANGGFDTIEIAGANEYTLGENFEGLVLWDGSIKGIGNAANNRIEGNEDSNVIDGRAGADTMIGGLGSDSYYVDDAGDVIIEAEFSSETWDDTDIVYSSAANFTLGVGVERLILTGTASINATGGSTFDAAFDSSIIGNAGDNTLDTGTGFGFTKLLGGLGNDIYIIRSSSIRVTELAGEGIDTARIAFDFWSYTLPDYIENVELMIGANYGYGNGMANRITGNAGYNVLDGGVGADTMVGGLGGDTYYVDDPFDVVDEDSNAGIDTVNVQFDYTLGANVENLTLTGTNAINGTGNSSDNTITGNSGNNSLSGGVGGVDTLIGDAGNDTYIVDRTTVTVHESTGNGTDTVRASMDFVLGANFENLILTGGASISGFGNDLANVLEGNLGSNVLIGGAGADSLSGGDGADYLLIDGADIGVSGGAGFDSVFVQTAAAVTLNMGTASLEWVQGNSGADTFNAASQTGAVYIYGQGGNDTITGSAFGDYLDGGDGTDTLSGGDGADLMLGNGGSDVLRGQGGDDSLIELGGDSLIDGGAGFDSLFVWSDTGFTLNLPAASIEWVQGSVLGDDNLNGVGNTVNTFLYGWGGNDKLKGGSGDDYIAGGAGDDILTGGAGNDTMIGEAGFDRYVYTAAVWGSDTIHSFDFNGEKLDFRTVAGIDSFTDFTAYEWDPLGLGYNSTTLFYTSGGTTSAITLIGVQTASLSDADFLFA